MSLVRGGGRIYATDIKVSAKLEDIFWVKKPLALRCKAIET